MTQYRYILGLLIAASALAHPGFATAEPGAAVWAKAEVASATEESCPVPSFIAEQNTQVEACCTAAEGKIIAGYSISKDKCSWPYRRCSAEQEKLYQDCQNRVSNRRTGCPSAAQAPLSCGNGCTDNPTCQACCDRGNFEQEQLNSCRSHCNATFPPPPPSPKSAEAVVGPTIGD